MGWRYKKRIKILPGIHLNISKSGISTNVGVKGANVTFGKKGTYVNTSIPGTGLYRRDKVSESSEKDKTEVFPTAEKTGKAYKAHAVHNSHNEQKGFDEKTSYLSFKPSHYVFYFWPFFFSLAPLSCFHNNVNILYGCLFNALFQLILSFAITSNMSVNKTTTGYNIKLIGDATIDTIRRDIIGHIIRCSLSIVIAIINLLPLFLMNKAFKRLFCGFDIAYEGGWGVIPITLFVIVCWIVVFFKERNMITPLKNIVALKDGKMNMDDSKYETPKESAIDEQQSSSQTNESVDKDKQEIGTVVSSIRESLFAPQPQEDLSQPFDPYKELKSYKNPHLDLLRQDESKKPYIDADEMMANKNQMVKTLNNFGVMIREIRASPSPKFTLYEVTLAPNVHASIMDGLEDDIALAFCSHNVQIISPIPGKGRIGILVPKTRPGIVSVRNIFDSKKFIEEKMDLPCAIGKTISNETFIFDLAKSPHILIAGPTGQGKSVLINVIIDSLLFKKHPADMKLVLMEHSGLELGPYSCIQNHFLASFPEQPVIVSNSNQAVNALNSLCKEMDRRIDLLKDAHTPNIKDYNRKIINRQLIPASGYKYMPYIVVVIDEYGFFIEEKGSEIERPIIQLAKYARTAGIHMILSTRQLTKETITDSIKDNIPTRISFKMPDKKCSQLILDCDGAEQLLGCGDLLYTDGGPLIRIQGAYVDTYEVDCVNEFISNQKGYEKPFELPDPYEYYEGSEYSF